MKKNAFRIIAPVLALTMAASSFAYADGTNATVPSDVKGTAAEKAVSTLMETGAVTGDTDGLFHPESNLTRAQVCKMLVTLIDPPKSELTGTATQSAASSGFTDLAGASWAKSYIEYAAAKDIAKGYGDKTFKPSGDVTLAELVTFTVRACGYTDSDLDGTWPENYIKKAEELGLFADIDLAETSASELANTLKSTLATKEEAAIVLYNAVSAIEKYEAPAAEWTLKSAVAAISKGGLKYSANGSFDANVTSYDGVALADNVMLLTYGKKTNYSDSMTFSQKLGDYEEESVYKMKNVSTPAYYKVENGEITLIVLPENVGFTGKVYCVINDTDSYTTGSGSAAVGMYETLSAMQEITWTANESLSVASLDKNEYLNGQVYELYTKKGVVQQIARPKDATKKNADFKELTDGWREITDTDLSRNLVRLENRDGSEEWVEIAENASVYVLNDEDGVYTVGSEKKLKDGAEVRMYDIDDEDDDVAYIIVVK